MQQGAAARDVLFHPTDVINIGVIFGVDKP